MRTALVTRIALSLSATPLGVFLLLRRMSRVWDGLSHAVLPGAAIGYLISGLSLIDMDAGRVIAGPSVALLSGAVSRYTSLREDASFAGFCLGALSPGVTLVSIRSSSIALLHALFGSLVAVDNSSMLLVVRYNSHFAGAGIDLSPFCDSCLRPHYFYAQNRWTAPLGHDCHSSGRWLPGFSNTSRLM